MGVELNLKDLKLFEQRPCEIVVAPKAERAKQILAQVREALAGNALFLPAAAVLGGRFQFYQTQRAARSWV